MHWMLQDVMRGVLHGVLYGEMHSLLHGVLRMVCCALLYGVLHCAVCCGARSMVYGYCTMSCVVYCMVCGYCTMSCAVYCMVCRMVYRMVCCAVYYRMGASTLAPIITFGTEYCLRCTALLLLCVLHFVLHFLPLCTAQVPINMIGAEQVALFQRQTQRLSAARLVGAGVSLVVRAVLL